MANFYDILKNLCVLIHEDLPASFSDASRPYPELKQYIKDCIEEICSKFPWTFRERVYNLDTVIGQREYLLPEGVCVYNILQDGVRIEGTNSPLYFLFHNELDSLAASEGRPYRYSVYSSKLILDPVPDQAYNIRIKYLTVNYAFDATKTVEKPNIELEDDISIIPDRFLKVIYWGAYSLFRQNYKPDDKYRFAREKYLEYLIDMQKQDGYSNDASASIVIDTSKKVTDIFSGNSF